MLASLSASGVVILRAPPGTGKSTRIPPALLRLYSGKILVLEPRRLAARLCAERVAQELGGRVGGTVGYRIRFESAVSKDTRLEFLTEGLFIRLLLDNPTLQGVDAIVIDEFHERHMHTDLALLAAKCLRESVRPDLRLLVMSATLGTEVLAGYLPGAVVHDVQGRHFDVRMDYLANPMSLPLEKGVQQAVVDLLRDPACPGHILVFLSGFVEQRRCAEVLAGSIGMAAEVLVLHSSSSQDEQGRVFAASDKRKIVLATNIAETSLTIDGVTGVVDSGFAKIPVHSPFSGHLELIRRAISQASAIQRAGRAGRTASGVCKRLYTSVDYQRMAPFERPEIERLDFTQTLLETQVLFAAMTPSQTSTALAGPRAIDQSRLWLTPPAPAVIAGAEGILRLLGAIDSLGQLTALGRAMAKLPLHPRLSRLLVGTRSRAELACGVLSAAALSEEFSDLQRGKVNCDLLGAIASIQALLRNGSRSGGDRRLRLIDSLCRAVGLEASALSSDCSQESLAEIVMRGFPDRVCQLRRTSHAETYVMAQGGHGSLSSRSGARGEELVIALEIQQGEKASGGFRIEMACPLSREAALAYGPTNLVAERQVVTWDTAVQCVRKKTQTVYGDLCLEEANLPPTVEQAKALLQEMLRRSWPKPFADDKDYLTTRERLRLLISVGELDQSVALEAEPSAAFLDHLASGRLGFSQVGERTLSEHLRDFLTFEVWSRLETQCPREVQLKGKKFLPIRYEEGRPPWIESKIQDFFGTTAIPKLASGRISVTVQLLAPNGEAVQTTQDLPRFWREGYPSARATWSRHYPRHFWPEDPLTAPAMVHRPRGVSK